MIDFIRKQKRVSLKEDFGDGHGNSKHTTQCQKEFLDDLELRKLKKPGDAKDYEGATIMQEVAR
jgi:hypothetical protein